MLPNLENIIIALAGKCRRFKMYAIISSVIGEGGRGVKMIASSGFFPLYRNPDAIDEKV